MQKQKALFLDRDGIINVDHGYVYKIEDFEFSEGIFELLHLFINKGYLLFIVTNQSGIGREYYSVEAFNILTVWMKENFQKRGIHIEDVQYCPHTPNEHCHCRKPHIGMIENILTHYNIDLNASWMIGDKQSDIELAINANIGTSIAITEKELKHFNYTFTSVALCTKYMEENKDKIV
ncbi:MAG: D-glycero-beta-D-manno-heptose 1,7-bisphosphate 7-phosphatase [Campylobacterota bacterium]|nr:D-glycero-beta-D-manno-heptose 1,7-bisphosphate 7-phosphatase [Campylobacterota bacterium]